jgi:uroporphyrinogen-III synthase
MRILLTRPKEDAVVFAGRLRELGHEALSAPLLTIRFRDGPQLALDGVQGILVTSANGVRALARRTEQRDLPVFAVGPQTAREARKAGFARVECANGDVAALSQAVPRWAKADAGALLYATDAEGGRRLAILLTAKGYEVNSAALYDVLAATVLPQDVGRALEERSLDAAVFFSPRNTRVFRDCVLNAHLADACVRLAAICISNATAEALAPLSFQEIRVAARPNQDALLACFA